jgi:hypothetical protein
VAWRARVKNSENEGQGSFDGVVGEEGQGSSGGVDGKGQASYTNASGKGPK